MWRADAGYVRQDPIRTFFFSFDNIIFNLNEYIESHCVGNRLYISTADVDRPLFISVLDLDDEC